MDIIIGVKASTQDAIDWRIANGHMLTDNEARLVAGNHASATDGDILASLHKGFAVDISDLSWTLRTMLASPKLPVETVRELAALAVWTIERTEINADLRESEALELVEGSDAKIAAANRRTDAAKREELYMRATLHLVRQAILELKDGCSRPDRFKAIYPLAAEVQAAIAKYKINNSFCAIKPKALPAVPASPPALPALTASASTDAKYAL
jgi:hypothetical protein